MSKTDRYDLTRGNILRKLLLLAMPIMAGQFVQTAYNITDMFWLGRLGGDAVAASGTVGFYMWLSMALQTYGGKGAEIGVSQCLGRKDAAGARAYGRTALSLSLVLGLLFGAALFVFRNPLIGFFGIREANVVQDAIIYLSIISIGVPFTYLTSAAAGIFTGSGNSTAPFIVNAIALALNMVLDPILIFTAGMGVSGAALATVIAQALATTMLLISLKLYRHETFHEMKLRFSFGRIQLRRIFFWATPIAIESCLFTLLSMIISRFIAAFGAGAIAAQRLGSQVESLSYLIAGGFSSAFVAFIGQNFGAGRVGRIHRGMRISIGLMTVWGLLVTAFLFFGGGPIVAFFLPNDPDVVAIGAEYMRILSVCQLMACYEGIASGIYRGIGKTIPPSVISVTTNACRVVAAWLLSQTSLGLTGIWWAITIGAAVRGLCMFIAGLRETRKLPALPPD